MPRRGRCVLPEMACHMTQRGVDRRDTFSADEDRQTYLRLLQGTLEMTSFCFSDSVPVKGVSSGCPLFRSWLHYQRDG
ncbi:MAG: hypothetical protein M1453_10465 [Acidobacteria bacterium]|nr:hypothetical protein [Acidobacteriota bacterium]